MGRGEASNIEAAPGAPRTVVGVEYVCSACGERSSFDGIGGEWCRDCGTAEHLVAKERLYRLVEMSLD